ncbi:MAG: hypothetical protein Q4C81_04305 [Kocuria sp.]|nr:hypothetical protein [Kocuria sp.]
MAQTFAAKYRGPCGSAVCDRRVEPGDQVVFVDQQLFHDECALDSALPAPVRRAVCPECFTEVSVSGACSC